VASAAAAASTPPATSSVAAPSTAASAPLPARVADGEDFVSEARVLYRVGACGPSGEMPSRFDAAVVARHCDDLSRAYAEYRKSWVEVAMPFLAALRPKEVSKTIVYPFGGGDLVSALATFPDATEITTVSLEPAGDIRPIDKLAPARLAYELAVHRDHLVRLFQKAHSRTDNLEKESKTELPGEIVFDLAALVVHGAEPVSLRYFTLKPDGSIAYVTRAQVEAAHGARDLRKLFENVELAYRLRADAANASPVRVVRHIAFNLDDDHLKADGSLLAYLSARGASSPAGSGKPGGGGVAAMTKAASHLLWNGHFGLIRGWLLEHVDWMISDSTGIPPRFAGPAGFSQETYGTFKGPAPFGLPDARDASDLERLFASQPTRSLPFRYGYPDKDGHAHLVVTSRVPHAVFPGQNARDD
jgi:hypothetical protein